MTLWAHGEHDTAVNQTSWKRLLFFLAVPWEIKIYPCYTPQQLTLSTNGKYSFKLRLISDLRCKIASRNEDLYVYFKQIALKPQKVSAKLFHRKRLVLSVALVIDISMCCLQKTKSAVYCYSL